MNQYQYTQSIFSKKEELKETIMTDIGLTEEEAEDAIEESDIMDDMQDRTEHDNHVTNNQI